ncbi:little elongation complex subunit 1 isoform X2 [Drosophila innubila]|uniref:little elongation complex subunit 1 isoform X2 n=1 Tax=Drosophila innubila TaxID=198719 RepID=UPI00148B4580|nr:little elongation complex subunit 1 isoform X2 [Drosophila innubila]
MPEDLDFDELDFLLGPKPDQLQNEINAEQHVQRIVPAKRESSKKARRLAERIAETDELVRQLKQLKDNQQQLKDLQRSAGEVTQLYHCEKQKRIELEARVNEQSERCTDLEKQLDVQQLNCEELQEQLTTRALPVDARDMVSIFMQLTQRVGEDSHASGLLRREQNLLRKLKDYCKSAKINIPPMKSSTGKRPKVTTAAVQATQTTQTDALQELAVIVPSKPEMCSIAVQSEILVSTRNQGTQHKNMTTTRGTTTASFIKKHDVGTCFPEPKPALSVHQILDKMLSWNKSCITPLSPIVEPQPEPEVLQTISMGTCTDLCNVQRAIDYLPDLPAELKQSRPPSRASVKDELAMPMGAAALNGYGHHMAKELLHFLPHSQSILTNLPPHVFEEIWQVMGQMVLVALQRRSTNSSVPAPMPAPTINQADFGSWFEAYESNLNQLHTSNKDAEFQVPSKATNTMDVATDPMMTPPPEIGLDLTPIRLLVKPKFRVISKPKPKPKKKKRRVTQNLKAIAKRETIASKTAATTETAVQFLSNLNVFTSLNCDNLDIQLDAEELKLLELTSAAENNEKQTPAASFECDEDTTQRTPASLLHKDQMRNKENSPQNAASSRKDQTDDRQLPAVEDEADPLQKTPSSRTDQNQLLFDKNGDSDDEETPTIEGAEICSQGRLTSSSIKEVEESASQNNSLSSFLNDQSVDGQPLAHDVKKDTPQNTSSSCKDQTDDRQLPALEDEENPPQETSGDSDVEATSRLEGAENCQQSRLTSSSIKAGDLDDEKSTPRAVEESLSKNTSLSSSRKDEIGEDSPQNSTSSLTDQNKLLFDSQWDSDNEMPPALEVAEDCLLGRLASSSSEDGDSDDGKPQQSRSTSLSRKDKIKLLFDSDGDSDDGQSLDIREDNLQCRLTSSEYWDSEEEQLSPQENEEEDPQSTTKSSSHSNRDSVDGQHSLFKGVEIPTQSTSLSPPRTDQVDGTEDSSNEQPQLPKDKQSCLPIPAIPSFKYDSDVDSVDSNSLVIDDGNTEEDKEHIELSNAAIEPIVVLPVAKRKRNSSSCSSCDNQPFEKRVTRSQVKQLELMGETKTELHNLKLIKVARELQSSCISSSSPMSPVSVASCEEESDCEPIEIPLETPGREHSASEPKALLSYVVNEVKADAKHRKQQEQQQNRPELKQLKLKIVNWLKNSVPLDTMCIKLITENETVAFDVITNAFGNLGDDIAVERLLTMVGQIECQKSSFIERFMNSLEQRLFSLKVRLTDQLALKYVRLFLQLTGLQSRLTVPAQSYVNPARLLLAKILYHYSRDVTMLVLEVLRQFPTVLPHREERGYDNGDPLITVIKHLLMSHKYDMQDAEGPDRALLSKLRFEYHFQPYEPTKQQVIENLVEKLKAGRLHHLCYAFALFCRRSVALHVEKDILEAHLLPLVNSYCDLCLQSEEYDARVECLLQSVSMIVKQLPLHNKFDISNYIAIFKRLLVAGPRPGVQQAAVHAILRTQRFGYGIVLEALQGYRPNYQLSPMTRAMMRSFAERRVQYTQAYKASEACGQKKKV